MDINNLKGLMEAYQQVNAPEQIDEVLDTPEKANEYARKNVKSMVGAFVKGAVNKDISQLKTIEKRKRGAELGKRKAERKAAEEQKESFDVFDIVLEFLQAEGYAETLEEAQWMMANVIDEKAVAIILEAMHEDEDEEDEKEMKKGKKSKKEEEDDEDEDEEKLDEAIRNPESRKKLRAIMDREVVKGDKSKGQNPRKKYHTKTGDQAFSLLMKRDETGSKGNPVRSRGGTNAPADERVGKGPARAGNAAYWAGNAGPTRDRGAGNKAARRAGKSVPNTRYED